MVRGVSFELLVLPVNINGFYMLFFLTKRKRKQLLLGERVPTFYGVYCGLHTVREIFYTFSLSEKVTIMIEFYWDYHHQLRTSKVPVSAK